MSDEAKVEAMIQAAGATAPRLTPTLIDETVVGIAYHRFPDTTVTVCCLTLRNGHSTVGHSACISPENFNEGIGREIAYKNAREKIWPLEGYLMRERLSNK